METTLLSVLPYLTPAGVVVLVVAIIYKQSISDWLSRSSKVTDAMSALSNHIEREEMYWANTEGRLSDLEGRLHTQEINSVEVRVTLQKNHEEILREVTQVNERIGQLTNHLIEHIGK